MPGRATPDRCAQSGDGALVTAVFTADPKRSNYVIRIEVVLRGPYPGYHHAGEELDEFPFQ